MNNYTFYNPTKLYFGPDQIENNLGESVKKYGDKVLLMYGGGSIKKNGTYDRVSKHLRASKSMNSTASSQIHSTQQSTRQQMSAKSSTAT